MICFYIRKFLIHFFYDFFKTFSNLFCIQILYTSELKFTKQQLKNFTTNLNKIFRFPNTFFLGFKNFKVKTEQQTAFQISNLMFFTLFYRKYFLYRMDICEMLRKILNENENFRWKFCVMFSLNVGMKKA